MHTVGEVQFQEAETAVEKKKEGGTDDGFQKTW